MLNRLREAQKRNTAGMDATQGQNRVGLVTSFNPVTFAARVTLAASNVDVGWCDVLVAWVGAGWGVTAPLSPGDEVLLLPVGGSGAVYVVAGRYYNDEDPPPQGAAAGEFWLVHQTGSVFSLKNDGSINLSAETINMTGTVNINGNVATTGTITNNGKHVDSGHTHGGVQIGGNDTGVPV